MERKRFPHLSGLTAVFASGVLAFAIADTGSPRAVAAEERVILETSLDRPVIEETEEEARVVLQIEIEGCDAIRRERTPLNLAIVLDRSGSMRGGKLEQAKQAASYLVDQLDPGDVLSVVVYDTEVDLIVPPAPVEGRTYRIQDTIRDIRPGGSTALYGGVESGGKQLREFFSREKVNRVILLSDGIANVGPSSDREIAGLGHSLAEEGISVTTIGLGLDYNETLLITMAEASDANYYYVADVEALPEVFREELGGLKRIVAREIEIEIRCPRGIRPIRFLGRPERFESREGSVRLATLSGGQSRKLHLECAIEPAAMGEVTEIAEVSTRFLDPEALETVTLPTRPIVVGYTRDREVASAVVDNAVVAEAAIVRNAEETEKAVALADQGDIEASKARILQQQRKLEAVLETAPTAQQEALAEEISSLGSAAGDLESGTLSKSQRKVLTDRAWRGRSAK